MKNAVCTAFFYARFNYFCTSLEYLKKGLFILFLLACSTAYAQSDTSSTLMKKDNEVKPRKHSPKTATLLSLALPGAGQVYNRKNWWWKVPVIYGAGAAFTYGVIYYNSNYNDFRDAYKYRIVNNVEQNGDPRFDKFQTPTLLSIRESYREARDQCIIGVIAVYALQIVDAAVEAHFFDFNVSDDLSLNIQPTYIPGPQSWAGVQFNLKLK